MALAYTVRDRMLHRYIATLETIADAHIPIKVVAYLSAEFLTGPHLGNSLINLGIWKATEDALATVGQDLPSLLEQEEEPGLGNGGLGRLAACYMDSLATLNLPAIGYGLRYEFGIFDQAIRDGWQVELTDKWLRFGNPWEIVRPENTFEVNLGGHTEHFRDERGSAPCEVGAGPGRERDCVRHSGAGLPRADDQCAAPVEGRGSGVVRLRRVQRRRLLRRRAREDAVGDDLQGPLSERRTRRGKAAAAGAAVLLRLMFAAGHDPPHAGTGQDAGRVRCVLGGPVERHASIYRHRRIDAALPRRALDGVG